MHVLAIGEPYDRSIQKWPEGCHYNFDASGHWLHYLFIHPSKIEISSIQQGAVRFGLYVHGPVIFLLHQLGDLFWNDAPYSWWRVPAEHRRLPEVSGGVHALVKTVLVDTSSGLVAALRVLTFSAEFTRRLHEAILLQTQSPWDPAQHDQVIREVYSRFSTEDLVHRAEILCKGGD